MIFRNHHAEFLEQQLRDITIRYERERNELRILHEREIDTLTRVYTELKTANAEELSRAIQENAKLRDDLDRTRLFLTPALQSVSIKPDDSAPPSPSEIPTGTPWQRILAREIAAQERQAASQTKASSVTGVPAAAGGSDGSNGEGRVEAP